MTLSYKLYVELEHVRWHQHMPVDRIGVGVLNKPQACRTENARFIALVSHFQQFEVCSFTSMYRLVVLTAHTTTEDMYK